MPLWIAAPVASLLLLVLLVLFRHVEILRLRVGPDQKGWIACNWLFCSIQRTAQGQHQEGCDRLLSVCSTQLTLFHLTQTACMKFDVRVANSETVDRRASAVHALHSFPTDARQEAKLHNWSSLYVTPTAPSNCLPPQRSPSPHEQYIRLRYQQMAHRSALDPICRGAEIASSDQRDPDWT